MQASPPTASEDEIAADADLAAPVTEPAPDDALEGAEAAPDEGESVLEGADVGAEGDDALAENVEAVHEGAENVSEGMDPFQRARKAWQRRPRGHGGCSQPLSQIPRTGLRQRTSTRKAPLPKRQARRANRKKALTPSSSGGPITAGLRPTAGGKADNQEANGRAV